MTINKAIFMCVAIGVSCLDVLGCGYHFRKTGEPIGIHISSLAIPLMTSTASSLGFEGDVTRVIREEFITHSKFPIVSSDKAAVVLKARIYDIKTEPLAYRVSQQTVQGVVSSYEVTNRRWLSLRLDARLIDRATGKVIWEESAMEEKADFLVTADDPLANRYYQKTALETIARRLAKRIYAKTMERF